jgi:hypothetical protein
MRELLAELLEVMMVAVSGSLWALPIFAV